MFDAGFSFEMLLDALKRASPSQVKRLRANYRKVQHGLLTVGIKLHLLEEFPDVEKFFEDAVKTTHYLGDSNRPYRHAKGVSCIVLPPAGNAPAAIELLECLERSTNTQIFNNPKVQIQVCSPGRLELKRAAFLSVGFYLGSDVIRRYKLEDLETTFANHPDHPNLKRGRRLAIWDGNGQLIRNFKYWERREDRPHIRDELPFNTQRTDVVPCESRQDIMNVNLLATLLVHSQNGDFWNDLGDELMKEMEKLLADHQLHGALDVPWICTSDEKTLDDTPYFGIFTELMEYAFLEQRRMEKEATLLKKWLHKPKPPSILISVQVLLHKCREKLVEEAQKWVKESP
ncbi:hypothetical protein KW798_00045 [Candidatus Parcubacteria bacterium]|nr:hypothetical protein [Candidatus Parcubacteria bacterium]